MRNNNLSKVVKNFKPALLVLVVALAGVQPLTANSFGSARTASSPKTELPSATEAKRALAQLGSQDFSKVRDPKMRLESRQALGVLKAMASNTSKEREKELIAKLNRSILKLKGMPQPTKMSFEQCDATYERCIEMCKNGAGDCDLCGIAQNGCYLVKLAAAIGHEGD
jgi:hypothetical protein